MWKLKRKESILIDKDLKDEAEHGSLGHRRPAVALKPNIFQTHNSVVHQIPIINIIWIFLEGKGSSKTTWSQVAFVLESVSIVAALLLALAIMLQSAVSFDELVSVDSRFEEFSGNVSFGHRTIDNLDINGGYAAWWYGTQKGQDGGDCTSDDCEKRTYTLTQKVNEYCVISSCLLILSTLITLLTVVVGSLTPIANATADVGSAQYQRVMAAYMVWIRGILVVGIFSLVLGLLYFLLLIQSIVFLKFPDHFVEENFHSGSYPGEPNGWYTIYGYANGLAYYNLFLPLFVVISLLSIAQRSVYTYPMQPPTPPTDTNLCGGGEDEGARIRKASHAVLTKWLNKTCHLPLSSASSITKLGLKSEEEDMTEIDYNYTYLSFAGGAVSNEAEVIADIFIDSGIMNVSEVVAFIETGDDRIYDLPGISLAAASQIVWQASYGSDNFRIWWLYTPHNASAFDSAGMTSQTGPNKGQLLEWNGFSCKFVLANTAPSKPMKTRAIKPLTNHPDQNKVKMLSDWNAAQHGDAFALVGDLQPDADNTLSL
eukprot:m.182434 g.182434  ORF g.182434 m.182434 type:complete len:541 (+) comp32116_c0_seq1:89-1711(+)